MGIALGLQLHWTAPSYDALPGTCYADTLRVCNDVVFYKVLGIRPPMTEPILLRLVPGLHPAGTPVDVEVGVPSEAEAAWTFYVQSVDTAGNESCWSNPVTMNGVISAPPSAPVPQTAWYDIAGRKLPSKPSTPGVYFEKQHSVRKVIIVR